MVLPLKTGGHLPQGRPTQGLDRPRLFFNAVGSYVFILDFGGSVSEVVCGSGTIPAPHNDVAEVNCCSGTRAWALVWVEPLGS